MPLHFHAGSVGTRLGKDGALRAWSGCVAVCACECVCVCARARQANAIPHIHTTCTPNMHIHCSPSGTHTHRWVVSHDPPKTREKALSTIQQRLEQLKREQENDTSSTEATGYADFYSPAKIRERKIGTFQSILKEAAENPARSTVFF